MPSFGDDKFFGGKPGSAAKAFKAMQKTYGKDAEHVYKAKIAKAKRKGAGKKTLAQRLLG